MTPDRFHQDALVSLFNLLVLSLCWVEKVEMETPQVSTEKHLRILLFSPSIRLVIERLRFRFCYVHAEHKDETGDVSLEESHGAWNKASFRGDGRRTDVCQWSEEASEYYRVGWLLINDWNGYLAADVYCSARVPQCTAQQRHHGEHGAG